MVTTEAGHVDSNRVKSGLGQSLEGIVKLGVDPKLVASTITQGLKDLKSREAVPIENIRDDHVFATFEAFRAGQLQKQNIIDVLRECALKPDRLEDIIRGFRSSSMGEVEVRAAVSQVIKENPGIMKKDRPEKVYMGLVMAVVRGKAPGDVVMRILMEEIKKG